VNAVNEDKYDGFYYDHLFVKYFIMNKNYKYDPAYIAYGTDMFLYLQLYKCIKRKPATKARYMPSLSSAFEKDYMTTEYLLDGNINESLFAKSEISILKILMNLCEDIKEVLHMRMTIEQHERVKTNLKVLRYVDNIYQIAKFGNINRKDITSDDPDILYIYAVIIDIIAKYKYDHRIFFAILTNIYLKIDKLYVIYNSPIKNKEITEYTMQPQEIDKKDELKISVDHRFKEFFLFLNDDDKEPIDLLNNPLNLEIIGSYSLWLGINLGSIEMPIHFKLLSVDYSHILPIPIFNSIKKNSNIMALLKNINDNGFVPSSLGSIVKKENFNINTNRTISNTVYEAVVKNLTKISKSRAQEGGKKINKLIR
jgi:predicted regulator of amino acid metabolism with ACT domain